MERYLVVATHAWNRRVFDEEIAPLPGEWSFVDSRDALTPDMLADDPPRYIFFIHWSWKVPENIIQDYECVAFHMTDLPYGRGGSPLQNLIIRGHTDTMLSAFRMSSVFDAGPVYMKRPLSLDGRAQEIYERASRVASGMISQIIREKIKPVPQTGNPTIFRRRRPEQSRMPDDLEGGKAIFDFIRMLDADGYPKAFITVGDQRIEFSDAELSGDRVVARVTINRDGQDS